MSVTVVHTPFLHCIYNLELDFTVRLAFCLSGLVVHNSLKLIHPVTSIFAEYIHAVMTLVLSDSMTQTTQ